MARRQATFSVENVVGHTSDELYRRTVALYNKLFVKTPTLATEVARAAPKSPTRKAPQATAAVVPTKQQQQASPPPPQKPFQQQQQWEQSRKRKRGGQWGSSNGGNGACFRCGEFGHKKEDCPLKNKGKSV